jgi:hypothetical protein
LNCISSIFYYYFQNSYIKFLFLSSYIKFYSNSHFKSQSKFQNFWFDLHHVFVIFNLDFILFNFPNHFKDPNYLGLIHLRKSKRLISIAKSLLVPRYFEYRVFLFFYKTFIQGLGFLFFEYCGLYFILLPKQRERWIMCLHPVLIYTIYPLHFVQWLILINAVQDQLLSNLILSSFQGTQTTWIAFFNRSIWFPHLNLQPLLQSFHALLFIVFEWIYFLRGMINPLCFLSI